MSTSTDERIVFLKLNNQDFERKSQATLNILDKLNSSLKMDGASKGIDQLKKASDKFSLKGMSAQVDAVQTKFSSLDVIAMTAINKLTAGVIQAGYKMGKALIDPIVEGGRTRALNIEQAKFQFKGLGMDVEATMADASYAVDGTAYSLDAAAKVASQLGASGMRAGEDMRKSLRAISGVAAMAGSSYEDIGSIFTKVAGQGRLMGDDLLRMSSRGINAAATIAKEFGLTETAVREMVTDGQISFDIFSQAMDSAFGEHATKANETYTGSLANVRSALGRIGELWFTPANQNMIPLFNALKDKINEIKEALTPLFKILTDNHRTMTQFMTSIIKGIDFTFVIKTITNFMKVIQNLKKAVASVIKPIVKAFQNIFPKSAKKDSEGFGKGLVDVTDKMIISAGTADKIRIAFEKFFGVFKNIKSVLGTAAGAFGNFVSKGISFLKNNKQINNGLTKFRDKIGDVVNRAKESSVFDKFKSRIIDLYKNIKNGKALETLKSGLLKVRDGLVFVYDKLKELGVIDRVRDALLYLKDSVVGLFDNFKELDVLTKAKDSFTDFVKKVKDVGWMQAFKDSLSGITDKITGFISTLGKVNTPLSIFTTTFGELPEPVEKVKDKMSGMPDIFKKLGDMVYLVFDTIKTSIQEMFKAMDINDLFTVGLVATIILLFRKLKKVQGSVKTELIKTLQSVQSTLTAWQNNLKANMLLQIAISIGILAASLFLLSKLSWDEIGKGLSVISILLAELLIALKVLDGVNIKKMTGFTQFFMVLTGVILTLVFALTKLSAIPAQDLFGAVAALTIMIAALVGALLLLNNFTKTAPKLLGVVKAFAIFAGAFSIAILAITFALMELSKIPFGTLMGSVAALTIVLGAFVGALLLVNKMANNGPKLMMTAKSLLMFSAALVGLGIAIVALAYGFTMLSQVSWEGIGKGFVVLVGAIGALILASMAISRFPFLLPIITALAVAIGLLGFAMLGVGAGAALMAMAMEKVTVSGDKGLVALERFLMKLIELIPNLAIGMAQGFVKFVQAISNMSPMLMSAVGNIIFNVLGLIQRILPQLAATAYLIIIAFLKVIKNAAPQIVDTGMTVLISLLKGIKKNIKQITKLAVDIIGEFVIGLIEGLSKKLDKMIDAVFDFAIDFINGAADAIRKNAERLGVAAVNLGTALIEGLIKGIKGAIKELAKTLGGVAKKALEWLSDRFEINSPSKATKRMGRWLIQGMVKGIVKETPNLLTSADYMAAVTMRQIAYSLSKNKVLALNEIESFTNELSQLLGKEVENDLSSQFDTWNQKLADRYKELETESVNSLTTAADNLNNANKALIDNNNQATLKQLEANVAKHEGELAKLQSKYQKAKTKKARNAIAADIKREKAHVQGAKKQLADFQNWMAAQEKAAADQKLAEDKANAQREYQAAVDNAARMKEAARQLAEDMQKIKALQARYSPMSEELDEINAQLDEMQKYKDTIKDAFSGLTQLSNLENVRTAQEYLEGLQNNLNTAQEFRENILELISLGYEQNVIDQVMAAGIESGGAMAQYLIDGATTETIDAINKTMEDIEAVGDDLGTRLANEFFVAGDQMAEGLMQGLEARRDELIDLMDALGAEMLIYFNRAVGNASPSKKFRKSGTNIMRGLVNGIDHMRYKAKSSMVKVSDDLNEAINSLDTRTGSFNPIITPLVDLGEVRKGFNELNGIIANQGTIAASLTSNSQNGTGPNSSPSTNTTNNSVVIEQNFNDRIATPVEVYNAAKFGVRGA